MSRVVRDLRKLLDYIEELEWKVNAAKYHIKRHIHDFPPAELECLAMDGLIDWTEIPEEKRTEYARYRAESRDEES